MGKYMRSMYMKPGTRRWYKKQLNRFERKWAKRDPENVPIKRAYKYWAD